MDPDTGTPAVLTTASIAEFFRETLSAALVNQQVRASEEVEYYLVNLLTGFARSETLFEPTPEGPALRPLAMLYADAVNAPTLDARNHALQRLGDVALFIAGLFAHSLSRKLVDVDYYIAMGGSAYGSLSDRLGASLRGRVRVTVFQELACRFTLYVDVLSEVGERANLRRDSDLMRLYELWLRTGSGRAAQRLRQAGICPSEAVVSRARH